MTSLAGISAEDRVLDFECGSGGFIAAAVQKNVPLQNVRGVDISALPAAVSKLYLALHFNVRGRAMDNLPVIHGNGLFEQGSDWSVVIGNPAGGNKYDPEDELGDIEEVYEVLERDLDQNERDDPASEYNFSIQRALRSAVVGGRICLVLPEGVFSNANTDYLRKYVTKYCKICAIISLPRGIFYKGTTTRTVSTGQQVANMKMSILFVEKVAEVQDEAGTDISSIDTNYPVFLASVSACPQGMDVNEYLNSVLELLLAEYKGWEESGELLQERVSLAYPTATKKKRVRRQKKEAKLKRSITVAQSSIDEVLNKPNTSEEAIISETFDDVF